MWGRERDGGRTAPIILQVGGQGRGGGRRERVCVQSPNEGSRAAVTYRHYPPALRAADTWDSPPADSLPQPGLGPPLERCGVCGAEYHCPGLLVHTAISNVLQPLLRPDTRQCLPAGPCGTAMLPSNPATCPCAPQRFPRVYTTLQRNSPTPAAPPLPHYLPSPRAHLLLLQLLLLARRQRLHARPPRLLRRAAALRRQPRPGLHRALLQLGGQPAQGGREGRQHC